jgi:hypothetical protein
MNFQAIITKGLSYLKELLITKGLDGFLDVVIPSRRRGGTSKFKIPLNISYILYGQKEIEELWKYKVTGKKQFSIFNVFPFIRSINNIISLSFETKGKTQFPLIQNILVESSKQFLQINKIKTNGKKQFELKKELEFSGLKRFPTEKKNKIQGRRDNSKAILAALYKFDN